MSTYLQITISVHFSIRDLKRVIKTPRSVHTTNIDSLENNQCTVEEKTLFSEL